MARYQPFTLQVQRPTIISMTTGSGGQNAMDRQGSGDHGEGEEHEQSRLPGLSQVLMGLLSLISTALLLSFFIFWEGRLNTWTNTKTMHYTRNKNIYSWMSIFPSQVYSNQDPAALLQYYRVVDGVIDQKPHDAMEEHGFQIAGGFGILTNISSNVYLSALVLIYMLSALDSAVLGVDTEQKTVTKPIYFTWASVLVGIVFVLWHMFQKFGTWHDVEWGTGANKVSVRYSWEAGASLLYATVVLVLYIMHINFKNGVWHALIPAGVEHDFDSGFVKRNGRRALLHIGTKENGPATKEASVLFAVTFFLLAMGILGDTRSVVLETDVQLVILCAFALSVVTLLSMRVRVYFEWTKTHFMKDSKNTDAWTHHDGHSIDFHCDMIDFVLQLAEIITIAISGLLLGVSVHVLATMFDSQTFNLLYFSFVIFASFFLFIRVMHLIAGIMNLHAAAQFKGVLDMWWDNVYFWQHVLSTILILFVLWMFLFTGNHGHDKLRRLESMQYLGMHQSDVAANSVCSGSGVQYNALLHNFMELKDDVRYNDISAGTDNPVSFKVFAWTRWWQLEQRQTGGKQGPAVYFCSNGLEQEFGTCAAELSKRPGVKFEENFQAFVDKVQVTNLKAG